MLPRLDAERQHSPRGIVDSRGKLGVSHPHAAKRKDQRVVVSTTGSRDVQDFRDREIFEPGPRDIRRLGRRGVVHSHSLGIEMQVTGVAMYSTDSLSQRL